MTRSSSALARSVESAKAMLRSARIVTTGNSVAATTVALDGMDAVTCDWQFAWQSFMRNVSSDCRSGSWHDPCSVTRSDCGVLAGQAYTTLVLWHARNSTAAEAATNPRNDLDRTMSTILAAQSVKGKKTVGARTSGIKAPGKNFHPAREPSLACERAAMAPSRSFASSNARIVASTSYGSSSKVLAFHSLRGVAKKSPP